MPITMILIASSAKLLFPDLSWVAAGLLGAVLSPTDPVITSAILVAEQIPERVRDTLRLESGLNDGLALPFVLLFMAIAGSAGISGSGAIELLGEAGGGILIGAALGAGGGWLLANAPDQGMTAKYEGLYAFGLGIAAFGLSELTIGNGLIAAFVCGVAIAAADYDVPESSISFSRNASTIFQVITITLFGALIINTDYSGGLLALIAFIAFALFIARPLAVMISFIKTELRLSERLFIGWFGPKGVASMLFALFVLGSETPHSELIFDVSSFVILVSILAHSLSEGLGISWLDSKRDSISQSGVEGVSE